MLVPQPEILSVADTYIALEFDIDKTAKALNMDKMAVSSIVSSPAMQSYIAGVFFESGFLNKSKFFGTLDSIMEAKLEEMQESETTSGKDIIDIMMAMHKMKMEEMKLDLKRIELEQAKNKGPGVAVQINNNGEQSPEVIANWAKVITKITNRGKK